MTTRRVALNPCLGCGKAIAAYGYCTQCTTRVMSQAKVTVVCGPPCSGKSSYVRERARPGVDLVVDYDTLAQAFGSDVTHGHSAALLPFVAAAREAVIARLRQPHDIARAYVIVTDRAKARQLWPDAELVVLDTPIDECHRRADAAGRPQGWHALIDAWR